jgi:hypothetical protein
MSDNVPLRDWLFAKSSKRLLLEALLREPNRSWTRTELAVSCKQHAKARMDKHLQPLLDAGVLQRRVDRYRLVADHPVVGSLRELLVGLGAHDLSGG